MTNPIRSPALEDINPTQPQISRRHMWPSRAVRAALLHSVSWLSPGAQTSAASGPKIVLHYAHRTVRSRARQNHLHLRADREGSRRLRRPARVPDEGPLWCGRKAALPLFSDINARREELKYTPGQGVTGFPGENQPTPAPPPTASPRDYKAACSRRARAPPRQPPGTTTARSP